VVDPALWKHESWIEIASVGVHRRSVRDVLEIAFAIWDGSGRDRSAQKAVSAGLLALDGEV